MLTRLVLIRHAKPLNQGYADLMRPLSEEGRLIHKRSMEHLKSLDIVPDVLYCSPVLRTVQTAEIISKIYDGIPVEIFDALGYDFDMQSIIDKMPHPSENKTVFLVGHGPSLTLLVNSLVAEDVLSKGLSTSMSVVIDFREPVSPGAGFVSGIY